MAHALMTAIDPAGIAGGQILHNSGKWNIRYLYRQMDMITHQTKCMHAMPESLNSFLNKKKHAVMIISWKKDILPTITPKHDVI